MTSDEQAAASPLRPTMTTRQKTLLALAAIAFAVYSAGTYDSAYGPFDDLGQPGPTPSQRRLNSAAAHAPTWFTLPRVAIREI